MTDRERSRRLRVRTALAAFAAVTVLAAGGVWFGQASDRASAVDAAPKTAAVQDVKEDGKPPSGLPGVRDCGFGTPVSKPHVITLACRDAGTVATGITWKYYGAREAFGAGTVQVEKTTGAVRIPASRRPSGCSPRRRSTGAGVHRSRSAVRGLDAAR